jgi:hypothetical protein
LLDREVIYQLGCGEVTIGRMANKIEIVIFVSRVATNDCPHDVLPMV